MEIAKNVRDFLVGMKETLTPEEETLLSSLQDLHENYLTIMEDFSVQVSNMALSMSPEARIVAHQLRVKIYQDWRTKLTERIFANAAENAEAATKADHEADCACCFCELNKRLENYKKVIAEFIEASPRIKSKPDAVKKEVCDPPDAFDPENDVFEFPEFLSSLC